MSQRDLVAELRSARPTAPYEVRERVRLLAASDTTARRPRVTWRRTLVVVLPVAAAVAAADLVLRIPRVNVQRAVTQLSQLGTITAEQVDVQDVQGGLDTTARTIARLQKRLTALRASKQTPQVTREIAALTALVVQLQR